MLHISKAITLLSDAATVCDEWVQTERISEGRQARSFWVRTHVSAGTPPPRSSQSHRPIVSAKAAMMRGIGTSSMCCTSRPPGRA